MVTNWFSMTGSRCIQAYLDTRHIDTSVQDEPGHNDMIDKASTNGCCVLYQSKNVNKNEKTCHNRERSFALLIHGSKKGTQATISFAVPITSPRCQNSIFSKTNRSNIKLPS